MCLTQVGSKTALFKTKPSFETSQSSCINALTLNVLPAHFIMNPFKWASALLAHQDLKFSTNDADESAGMEPRTELRYVMIQIV